MKAPPDVLRITIAHDGELVTTDPNGFAVMAMIPDVMTALLRPLRAFRSDISGEIGCVIYGDVDGPISLTPGELMRLAGLRLTPKEFFTLREQFGVRHPWHEDFYDPDTGKALQPREPFSGGSEPEGSPLDTLKELLPGATIIGLDDPELLHNTIAEAVGEPPLKRPAKRGKRGRP